MPDQRPAAASLLRFTVVTWPVGDATHAFIPALGVPLPVATSIDAALASARVFIAETLEVEQLDGLEGPGEIELQSHTIEVEQHQQLRLRPELLSAALSGAIGDVIPKVSDNRELLAVLLSVLTAMTVQLHEDANDPFDEVDLYGASIWSEERLQETVRDVLNYRLRSTATTSNERARLRRLVQQAIKRKLAMVRELELS